jgi:hypothetical protein
MTNWDIKIKDNIIVFMYAKIFELLMGCQETCSAPIVGFKEVKSPHIISSLYARWPT